MSLKIKCERSVKDRFLFLLEFLAVRRAGTEGVRQRKDKRVGKRGSLHGIGFGVKLGRKRRVKPLFCENGDTVDQHRRYDVKIAGPQKEVLPVLRASRTARSGERQPQSAKATARPAIVDRVVVISTYNCSTFRASMTGVRHARICREGQVRKKYLTCEWEVARLVSMKSNTAFMINQWWWPCGFGFARRGVL